jgi:hypothetical protein
MIFFKLLKEATLKISAKSEQLLAFVVKGLIVKSTKAHERLSCRLFYCGAVADASV